jgi:hypothetical protein
MELTPELVGVLKDGAANLEGAPRRRFMAGIVRLLGDGGQRLAASVLGWNRDTIRKGEGELESGVDILDGRRDNGRASVEERLATFIDDLRAVVAPFLQVDPSLRSERLYLKLTVAQVRQLLVSDKGHTETQLPCDEVIRQRLNKLGYFPQRVRKSKPKKRSLRPTRSSTKSPRSTRARMPRRDNCASL